MVEISEENKEVVKITSVQREALEQSTAVDRQQISAKQTWHR